MTINIDYHHNTYRRSLICRIIHAISKNIHNRDLYIFDTTSKNSIINTQDLKIETLIKKIINQSMVYDDIEKRYGMNINEPFTPEIGELYIVNAKKEYTKLINYLYHTRRKIQYKNYFIVARYPTDNDLNLPSEIPMNTELNKNLIINFKKIKEQIEKTQNTIQLFQTFVDDFTDPKDRYEHIMKNDTIKNIQDELLPLKKNTISIDTIDKNMIVVENSIENFEKKIKVLETIKEQYVKFDAISLELIQNKAYLKKQNLKYQLYLKTIKFDIKKTNNLPNDVVNHIKEYVGETYLLYVRQRCIFKKHFPNGCEEIKTTLKTWKKEDLRNYAKQTFIRYDMSTESDNYDYTYRRTWLLRSFTKDKIIEYITRNWQIFTFPDFQRDVWIINKILKGNQERKRKPKNKKTSKTSKTPKNNTPMVTPLNDTINVLA